MRNPVPATIRYQLPTPDALGTLLLRGLLAGSELVCGLVIARIFHAAGYGTYALVLSWIGLLAIPAAAGFDRYVIREIAVRRARDEWGIIRGLLSRSRTIVAFASVALALCGAVAAPFVVAGAARETVIALQLGMLAVPLVASNRLRQAALQGLGRVVVSQTPESIAQPIALLSLAGILYFATGFERTGALAVAIYVISCAVAWVMGLVIVRRVLPDAIRHATPQKHTGDWLRAAAPFMWILGMNVIMTNSDTILVGMLSGPTEAGTYRLASQMAMLISFPLTCVNMAVAPSVAASYAKGDFAALQATASGAARLIFLLTLPILGVLGFGGHYLLGLFGPGFQIAWPALMVLAAGQLVNVMMGTSGYLLIMTRHDRAVAVIFACAAVVNVVGSVIMIPILGILGAAIASATALALLSCTFGLFAWRRLEIQATLLPLRTASRGA
jgi:O-antigen/teichoic acid export membrane protein